MQREFYKVLVLHEQNARGLNSRIFELWYYGNDLENEKRSRKQETKHKKHVNWRRNKILTLLTQGCSTYEIAEVLKVSQSTADRDVLRKQAVEELKLHIQSLPHEYRMAYRGLSEVLKYAWSSLLTESPSNMRGVEFLSIQNAQSGSLSQINATAYTLELNNVANKTIQFSDRPNRIVETISTSDFVGNWTDGRDSLAEDAPNDVLIVEATQTGDLETSIIELFDPMYDVNTNTLTYTIMLRMQHL